MTYTAATQGANANPASTFMTALNTLLVAAGYTNVEQYPAIVLAASTANIVSLSGPQTVDGVALVAGNRVLVKNQTTASQNGIYSVASGAWTRTADATADGALSVGLTLLITSGTTLAGQVWNVTATGATPWIAGTSTSTWAFSTTTAAASPTAVVYKSPAASNGFGSDWYLSVSRTSDSATVISFSVAEAWNTATKKFTNYAPVPATLTPTAAFAVNDSAGQLPISASLSRSSAVTVASAGFQYWVSAHPNRLVVASRVGAADSAIYAGLYDDLLPVAISPFPLVVVSLNIAANAGAATREPNTTTSVGTTCFGVSTNSTQAWGPTVPVPDIYQAKYVPARAVVLSARANQAANPAIRGLFKDVLWCAIGASVNGDILATTDQVGATKTYTCMTTTGSGFWVDQAV